LHSHKLYQLVMVKAGEKKRSAAAAQRSDGSEAEYSDEEGKRRGSVRAPSSRNRDLTNVPVVAGLKAAAPQNAAATNASVGAAQTDTNQAGPVGRYANFELQMQLIQQSKPSVAALPVVTSPTKFGSSRSPKTSKVWVAGLKSGEMVAYVSDRYHAHLPAFIKNGHNKLRDDPHLCEKAMVSEIILKKADKEPFKSWGQAKVNMTSQSAYTLHWFVFVRKFKDLKDHTAEARFAWGSSLAKYFDRTDPPNKFEYGGDLSNDQACPASDFFKVEDVMDKFIMIRLAGQMSPSEIVQNSHLMASYYGDDPVLNSQVIQYYTPMEEVPDEGADEEEAKLNKELSGLF
jgi:hypothetical protein